MNSYNGAATGNLIKKLRTDTGLTLEQVGSALGVSKTAVFHWEMEGGAKTESLYNLAKFFNVTVSELFAGKLDEESNEDYWKRNYDLSNYDFDEIVSEKNLAKLLELFEHCQMVKNNFFDMLPKWAGGLLTGDNLNEFNLLKQYFKFDANYWAFVKLGMGHLKLCQESDEKSFVKEILEMVKGDTKQQKEWEISKLYDFTFNIKEEEICKSGSMKALEYMLKVLSPVHKDSLLSINIRREGKLLPIDQIENNHYIQCMVDNGCRYIVSYDILRGDHSDEDDIHEIEGIKIEDKRKTDLEKMNYIWFNFDGKPNESIFTRWKEYSLKDYSKFIDADLTEYISKLCNLKNDRPKEYLGYLLEKYADFNLKEKIKSIKYDLTNHKL